jgi:hypothetical protein
MSEVRAMERVWHEGQYELIAQCVQPNYIRHDEQGDRTVTRDCLRAEIAKTRQERPGIRIAVYDHTFEGHRAWFRFALKWTDPKTGEERTELTCCMSSGCSPREWGPSV